MKKWLSAFALLSVIALTGCSQKEGPNTVSVGTIAGPETQLMQVAKQVAKKRFGLHVKIVTFSDYTLPNEALNDGSIDANAFQHAPFLKAQVRERGYHIVPAAKTFLYPMALYSKKLHSLSQLKANAKVGIPNDPSNEARALLLFQKAKLIKLKPNVGLNATPVDIVSNPKQLQFVELDAAQLPRSLSDVALAAINTNYAIPAGLSPKKDALFVEGTDSPYVNIIAIRSNEKNSKKIKELIEAYQSKPVLEKAEALFGDGAIAGWKGVSSHANNRPS